jgi:hypothetical protein
MKLITALVASIIFTTSALADSKANNFICIEKRVPVLELNGVCQSLLLKADHGICSVETNHYLTIYESNEVEADKACDLWLGSFKVHPLIRTDEALYD